MISDEEFNKIVEQAIDAQPEAYKRRLDNIAFLVEDDPTPEQRIKLNLYPGETLFGLYEGTPLVQRGGATKLLPDKITVFKNPLLAVSRDRSDLRERIFHTIWHEVAHYFGLDHNKIHELDSKREKE